MNFLKCSSKSDLGKSSAMIVVICPWTNTCSSVPQSHDGLTLASFNHTHTHRKWCLLLNIRNCPAFWTHGSVMYRMSAQCLIITVTLFNVIYLYEILYWQSCTFRRGVESSNPIIKVMCMKDEKHSYHRSNPLRVPNVSLIYNFIPAGWASACWLSEQC